AIVAMILFMITSDSSTVLVQPSMVVQSFQFLVAMLVMDTWQYFVHRYMHQNKFLYQHIHSQHHRLIVPYAIGALYNHPLEGLLLDTLGGAMSFLVSALVPK
uniref:aldehyde oxygenase (deformylating) n=1 Tax=Aegilops tauschii subsp. strangulata TaxID=200361 RepID=A0A453B102_AEGTS